MDQGPRCPHGYLQPPQQFPYHHPPAFAAPSTTPQLQPLRIIPAQRFFNPWEPPPPPVPPPADCDLQKRIDKLVECAAKNGPQFEQLMKERQKDNALYSFLFGAEGHGFYRYKLWLTINHHLAPINPAFALVNPNLASVNPPLAPSGNGNGPMHGNCKKPPKPPKYPGRSSSLDAATLAAIKAAAARKKAMKQAAIRRRARVSDPANSGGTSLIALVLTLGFGVLMVFQGLFVQSNTTYGDSDETFVDIPSNQFGELSAEKSVSYGQSYQIDPELHSSPEPVDQGKADIVISTALYKSMQEIQFSRSSQLSGRFAVSG